MKCHTVLCQSNVAKQCTNEDAEIKFRKCVSYVPDGSVREQLTLNFEVSSEAKED